MRNMICELKVPFVVMAVFMAVWNTAHLAGNNLDSSEVDPRVAYQRDGFEGSEQMSSRFCEDEPVVSLDERP
jgi:hypothetical protein